ncbi:MAG: outer membrane protein assembly factor BamE [Lactobacillales bacterium]|jgi:outer membrane protein assembly factor BamE (lipoprotein component of BamABCDE complex)|nr:outer membrane protein assembly factor BamE [Lactobacillales bacterium]
MKKILCVFSLFVLSACADSSMSYRFRKTFNMEAAAYLGDKSQSQVENIMGTPSTQRCEGDNTLWVYRTDECTTFVYFDKDKQSKYVENRGKCDSNFARAF